MSKPSTVYDALVSQLRASSALSYIDDGLIFEGVRDHITMFPCLFVEPASSTEIDSDINSKVDITLQIKIVAFNRVEDVDRQIVGDTNIKGIFDLENDIKTAISSDRTLGGSALDAKVVGSDYSFDEWPIRSVEIEVEIRFRQIESTRT